MASLRPPPVNDDQLEKSAEDHPQEFPRNTGAGGVLHSDRVWEVKSPAADPDGLVIPSDSPGG